MKFKAIQNVFLVLTTLTLLTSCQEEEFYEKDFIDTLNDKYERANLPDELPGLEPGSENGGSENGGSENGGSENGGSENGGSENGGSENGGSENGGSETEEPVYQETPVNDQFTQQENGTKMDILWVIDNSGSMGNEQDALGENFDAFIKEFIEKDIDFQMAVTTTDTRVGYDGMEYKDSMARLTSENLKYDKNQFMDDFKYLVKVGTRGSGREKGLQASESFVERYNQSWIREDAYLTIVYISDEVDQSSKTVQEHLNQIKKVKSNNGLIKAYSILNLNSYYVDRYATAHQRYVEITETTNGEIADINKDFYSTLLNMGSTIANLTKKFPLSETPYDLTKLKVYVDNVQSSDWTYDSQTNSIEFNLGAVPQANSNIVIEYTK